MAFVCFCQAEDGIRDLVRSRGLGDVYKRQVAHFRDFEGIMQRFRRFFAEVPPHFILASQVVAAVSYTHLTLPTRDLVSISVVAVSLKKQNKKNKLTLRRPLYSTHR